MMNVLFAEDSLFYRNTPINTQCLIHQLNAGISFWVIEIITLILKYRHITKYRKAVSKPSRDKQLTMILFREFNSHMLTECKRTPTNIHSYVQDPTLNTTHKFTLRVRHTLIMQSTHHSICRHALVVLNKSDRTYLLIKLTLRERFKKVAACILKHTRLYNKHTLKSSFKNLHSYFLLKSSITFNKYWPY